MSTIDTSVSPAGGQAEHRAIVDEVSSWLTWSAEDVDGRYALDRGRVVAAIEKLNGDAQANVEEAFYLQQLLLSRIYQTTMQIPDGPTAEGSAVLHEVTRLLEVATTASEDRWIDPSTLDTAPTEPKKYLSWLKGQVRGHRAFKHPYYTEFINHNATEADLRTYVIQESLVDGRFDDFLAMMQIGTSGRAKLEIANNYWDEMGNGDPQEVHTHLFNKIYQVFDVQPNELEDAMTASDLLSGNLAVLLCRYRHNYPEAVGYLGMTEWLAPDRFTNVIRAWRRLNLPEVGITYHRLHVTIDSQHAAGWFHNVVLPAAESEYMRRGIARGVLWRINSSARHLDERLAHSAAAAKKAA